MGRHGRRISADRSASESGSARRCLVEPRFAAIAAVEDDGDLRMRIMAASSADLAGLAEDRDARTTSTTSTTPPMMMAVMAVCESRMGAGFGANQAPIGAFATDAVRHTPSTRRSMGGGARNPHCTEALALAPAAGSSALSRACACAADGVCATSARRRTPTNEERTFTRRD